MVHVVAPARGHEVELVIRCPLPFDASRPVPEVINCHPPRTWTRCSEGGWYAASVPRHHRCPQGVGHPSSDHLFSSVYRVRVAFRQP